MATLATVAPCRLCNLEKPLRNSHVTPKFLWKDSGLTGKGKNFEAFSPSHPHLSEAHRQDGFKERLLCGDCERRLSVHEQYAKEELFGKNGPLKIRPRSDFLWNGLNYPALKLFQLSILWRMGLSGRPFYSHVALGRHEAILRKMILNDDPGLPSQYGCICTLLEYKGRPMFSLFSQPRYLKTLRCYVFVLAGMHWFMFPTDEPPNAMCIPLLLRLSGEWILLKTDLTNFGYLKEQVTELKARRAKKA